MADKEDLLPEPLGRRRSAVVPLLLVACTAFVIIWEIMAHRSERGFAPFGLKAESMDRFCVEQPGWRAEKRDMPSDDPSAPNIMTVLLLCEGSDQVVVRLVHGYNMPDCMRLKGYDVELIRDTRRDPASGGATVVQESAGNELPCQIWRLTSDIGDKFIWATAMIRAADFIATDVDIRSMAFPRIGVRDDPEWNPQGLTWQSLKHPVKNMRRFLRAKWNNSRCDLATFLRLRQPAWASNEMLTIVAQSSRVSTEKDQEWRAICGVLSAQSLFYRQMYHWRQNSQKRASAAVPTESP